MNKIWNDIKSNFRNGNSYIRLLYINIGFFLVYKIWFGYQNNYLPIENIYRKFDLVYFSQFQFQYH